VSISIGNHGRSVGGFMVEQTISRPELMRAWRVHRYGRPSHALSLDKIAIPVPEAGEVRIRTRTAALNFNEVDGCYGRYITINPPVPYTLGMEVVGEVEAVGPGTEQWLGQRVMATAKGAYGGYADRVIADAGMVFKAPPSLDDVAAAGFFFPFHLAWLGLHERGRLQTGETVLVHAGAGGVGSAAIQLAVAAGARVLATAGGPEKVAKCRELGADVAIDYRNEDFAKAVLEATDGLGANLVFDGVGGDVTAQSLRCLAFNGRLMVIGFSGGIEAEDRPIVTPRMLCFGSVSLMGVMLAYTADPRGENPLPGIHITPRSVGERVQRSLEVLLAEGKIHTVIDNVVSFDALPAALDLMDNRQTTGRTIVVF
jgi:NADPH2:quinone reductase